MTSSNHDAVPPSDTASVRRSSSMLYRVKQVELGVRAGLEDALREAPITALQYTALTVLDSRGGMTAADLARSSFVTTQTMGGMVIALEKLSLVMRTRSTTDKRRMLVELTEHGTALLERHRDSVANVEAAMLDGLTSAETAAFRAALDACARNLRTGYGRNAIGESGSLGE
ncbi:MAG: MarR family transcriptional regulator [Rhodococcus sp. (in: high G+C Gram-positive bacteria)]